MAARTVVMTGGTSGFGAVAAARIAEEPDAALVQGARRPAAVGETIALDLADLSAVRTFVASLRARFAGRIDSLVLNAGLIRPDADARTVDGIETTFAVNHLAHHLLIRLLLPDLATGARIVVTTSGTHNPDTGASLATPRHADADLLAHPDRDPGRHRDRRRAGQHAYTASRLCNVLTVRTLARRPEVHERQIAVFALDPGQVFGTGLARHLSLPLRGAWALLGTPIGAPLRRIRPEMNTRAATGVALADLALGATTPPPGRTYAALRRGRLTWPDPSDLARDDELAARLWMDSVRLTSELS